MLSLPPSLPPFLPPSPPLPHTKKASKQLTSLVAIICFAALDLIFWKLPLVVAFVAYIMRRKYRWWVRGQ